MPEMTGGVFWEHLHRLVAGWLVLLFGLSTWLAKTPTQDQPWIFRACLAGLGLLIVQSIFGGLTVIYRLPDLISTTHLGLAFIFLALVTVLASATGPLKTFESPLGETANRITILASASAALIFIQSLIGGLNPPAVPPQKFLRDQLYKIEKIERHNLLKNCITK